MSCFFVRVRQLPLARIAGLLGAAQVAASCSREPPSSSPPPNIVLILTDDQGYGDLGCYGAENLSTPHLDRLASEGIRFTSFYAAASCSPARAALMTGCYAERVGMPVVLLPESGTALNPSEVTVAEALQKLGYETACVGKWHLGDARSSLPLSHGFDEYFGIPFSNDMARPGQSGPPLFESREAIEEPVAMNELTRRYTERAVEFVGRRRERPFFLFLSHAMPHVPLGVSEAFDGVSGQGLYADVIQELDWSVGEILGALKSAGLEESTLVVFASDNGPWLEEGSAAGSAGPFRNGKGSTWEGGVRVPCIMRWPGAIPASVDSDAVVTIMDLYPTFVEAAGGVFDAQQVVDGRSLHRLFQDPNAPSPHEAFFYLRAGRLEAVRQGEHKLHLQRQRGDESGAYLVNLTKDPGEKRNLASRLPERVQELRQLAKVFQADLKATTRRPAQVQGRRKR